MNTYTEVIQKIDGKPNLQNLLVVSTVEPEETDVNANASFESDTDESPSKYECF